MIEKEMSDLDRAYQAAQSGNEPGIIHHLIEYFSETHLPFLHSDREQLYHIYIKALEHNIRRGISLGLSTTENPTPFNLADLTLAKTGLERLIELRSTPNAFLRCFTTIPDKD